MENCPSVWKRYAKRMRKTTETAAFKDSKMIRTTFYGPDAELSDIS